MEIPQEQLAGLSNLIGYMILANVAGIVSGFVFLGTMIWKISKFHSDVIEMQKDLNGFGGRVAKVEMEQHSQDKRVTLVEHKVETVQKDLDK